MRGWDVHSGIGVPRRKFGRECPGLGLGRGSLRWGLGSAVWPRGSLCPQPPARVAGWVGRRSWGWPLGQAQSVHAGLLDVGASPLVRAAFRPWEKKTYSL